MTASVIVRRLAALSGASAVGAGAYGAHGGYFLFSYAYASVCDGFGRKTQSNKARAAVQHPSLLFKIYQHQISFLIDTAVLLLSISSQV